MKTCPQCQIRYPDALLFCPKDGTSLAAPAPGDPYIGSTIDGRYQIEAQLGEGGMGIVYRARHVIIDKRVAIKVLKKEAQEEPTAGQRFIQEAKSASKIGHTNIVDITDFGVLPDGSAYFVMEYLEGHTLGHEIGEGPLEPARVVSIAAQIARGLAAAHSKGIVHRDLKPENIFLLDREGRSDVVKIVDFGIAKVQAGGAFGPAGQRLTQVGMVLGTPEYMSPEQATGKDTDHRVDEYALGCMMYEMLTGDVPFRGETSAGTLTKHVFETVVPPSRKRTDLAIPQRLESVVLRTMAKTAEERYTDMKALLDALDGVTGEIEGTREVVRGGSRSEPVLERLEGDTDPGLAQSAAKRWAWVAVAAVAVLGAGTWGFMAHRSSSAAPPRAPTPNPTPTQTSTPTPTSASAAAKSVKLSLTSQPAGADVLLGPERLGVTPLEYAHDNDGRALKLLFRLAGYREVQRELVADGDRALDVTLVKLSVSDSRTGHARPLRRLPTGPAVSRASDTEAAVPAREPAGEKSAPVRTTGELRDPF